MRQPSYLPMSQADMRLAGWDALDVLLISGDAYVDHPSFGTALLGRWLVAHGFRVGVVAQPPWQDRQAALSALLSMGRPHLFVGVTAGAIDSLLAHYTAFRKKRRDDAYTPGGLAGARPNRACVVYTGLARQAFPHLPVVLGGIEASLRRVAHYDFWDDALRRPLLQDSKADLLVYGMGERALLEIARRAGQLASSGNGQALSALFRTSLVKACRDVPGLAWMASPTEAREWLCPPENAPEPAAGPRPTVALPSYEEIQAEPSLLVRATLDLERQVHTGGRFIVQESGGRALVLTPPAPPLNREEMDALYSLPYARLPHPAYRQAIPAWEMIRTSITTHRGCGGGCSFCSLALHQGRRIASRSRESIMREAVCIAAGPGVLLEEAEGRTGSALDSTGPPGAHRAAGSAKAAGQMKTVVLSGMCAPAKVVEPAEMRGPAGSSGQEGMPRPAKTIGPPRWAGSISDVGGPSANMWLAACTLPHDRECARSSCLHPGICPFFQVDQGQGVRLLRDIAVLPGVRHVRVASGVRFDLALRDEEALKAYTSEFTGGQLKVAPEHCEDTVLSLMRKPGLEVFERFLDSFGRYCRQAGKEQYVIPYLMSAFPGCTEAHMRVLATWLRKKNWRPQQVQCFIPTPGTVATAMFYAQTTPDGAPLYVARSDKERLRQHHILVDGADEGTGRPESRRKPPAKAPVTEGGRPDKGPECRNGDSRKSLPNPEAQRTRSPAGGRGRGKENPTSKLGLHKKRDKPKA